MEKSIGFLAPYDKGYVVVCHDCKPTSPYATFATEVYAENIGDYKQTCKVCGKLLQEGKTEAWPELFDGRN